MSHKSLSFFFKACLMAAVLALSAPALSTPTWAEDAAPRRLMVFGDSLVQGYGLAVDESFPAQLERRLRAEGENVTVINAGVSGDTTSAGLTRLDWSLTQNPQYAIVVIGGNDMLRRVDRDITRRNLDEIVARLRAREIPVLLAGMRSFLNLEGRIPGGFDRIYRDVARRQGALLYPFFLEGVATDPRLNLADGIHPNAEGVAVIVEKILPDVKKLLSAPPAPPPQALPTGTP